MPFRTWVCRGQAIGAHLIYCTTQKIRFSRGRQKITNTRWMCQLSVVAIKLEMGIGAPLAACWYPLIKSFTVKPLPLFSTRRETFSRPLALRGNRLPILYLAATRLLVPTDPTSRYRLVSTVQNCMDLLTFSYPFPIQRL